jgi:hypothetical protein
VAKVKVRSSTVIVFSRHTLHNSTKLRVCSFCKKPLIIGDENLQTTALAPAPSTAATAKAASATPSHYLRPVYRTQNFEKEENLHLNKISFLMFVVVFA